MHTSTSSENFALSPVQAMGLRALNAVEEAGDSVDTSKAARPTTAILFDPLSLYVFTYPFILFTPSYQAGLEA